MKCVVCRCLVALLLASATPAQADIFQWEYIDPADPGQGKQQSATLCVDGAGVDAIPWTNLESRNLTMAFLIGKDLKGANIGYSNLNNADLSQANLKYASIQAATLTNANLSYADLNNAAFNLTTFAGANLSHANLKNASLNLADLTGADLTLAHVKGANLSNGAPTGGLTLVQLYSTASYQAHDLAGIGLDYMNLTGADLAEQNLRESVFYGANLTNADLSQANLKNATLIANLTGADLTGTNVAGVNFNYATGLTASQLYSTASHQGHDLRGIQMAGTNLTNWIFAGQNLANAQFNTLTLNGANFTQANLTNAYMANEVDMTNANFSQANLTNAYLDNQVTNANFTDAEIRGASLYGLTAAQFYSTASYQAHDLRGVRTAGANGWDFTGQNLENAGIHEAMNANFSHANLTNAGLGGKLDNANFTDAEIRGANFERCCGNEGFVTLAQIYSTASYQNHDLRGVRLYGNNLDNGNFSGQNLTGAAFGALVNVNLSLANLTNVAFGGTLAGVDFSGSEIRGAVFYSGLTEAQLYSTGSYQAHDMTGINLNFMDLSGWNFEGQNLANAGLWGATLSGANFANADVRGTSLAHTVASGFTAAQLYSTASYQSHDLSRIALRNNDLTGWNFAGQNLMNADFTDAMLTGANFTGADVSGTNFSYFAFPGGGALTSAQLASTASYQAHDLTGIVLGGVDLTGLDFSGQIIKDASFLGTGITASQLYSTASYLAHDLSGVSLSGHVLTGWNFAGQNLTNADFNNAEVEGADFTGAEVRGANFGYSYYFTLEQLYSTASYQAGDLRGINLSYNYFIEPNFAGQNLTNSSFDDTYLIGPDLRGADLRGAWEGTHGTLSGIVATNFIRPDGHIEDLNLSAGQRLVVRDYDGRAASDLFGELGPISITVDDQMTMDASGVLRMEFEADAWDSTISFAAGIPVALGGSLELGFADDVSLASQIGRTFDVFDWTGVTPTGEFAVSSPYVWDLSNLYTTGEVMFLAASGLPGDFNNDNSVDAADYVAWRHGLGVSYTQEHYNVWRANFGRTLFAGSGAAGYGHRGSGPGASAASLPAAVPEPASLALVFLAAAVLIVGPRGGCPAKNSC